MEDVLSSLPCSKLEEHNKLVKAMDLPDTGVLQEDDTYVDGDIRYGSYVEYLEVTSHNTEFESVTERQHLTIEMFASENLQAMMKNITLD